MNTYQRKFIETIGNAAVKYYDTYRILPSLTIAQAILESGWGKTKLAMECNNYFGMKWSKTATCGFKTYRTAEQKKTGEIYYINARFRKYSSPESGIRGYYEFLQYKRYRNLRNVQDYVRACNLIRQDGWATDLRYTQKLIALIEDYRLYEYDLNVLKFDTVTRTSCKTAIFALQKALNREMYDKTNWNHINENGKYTEQTKIGLVEYWVHLGWKVCSGWAAGEKTCKRLEIS